ncbi:MAG: DEAD/DEAH box helicase, partial [Bdellovibrionales bacterium]|nr:DEAD/DEAH box helicase [Bdellovibrionales bacterium]
LTTLSKKFPFLGLTSSKNSLFISAEHVLEILKYFRDKKLFFAVDELAAKRLSASAICRKEILQTIRVPSEDDLSWCMLLPYLTKVKAERASKEEQFSLRGGTSEHLKICFPKLDNHLSRVKAASLMNRETLLEVIFSAGCAGLKLWETEDVTKARKKIQAECINAIDTASHAVPDSYLAICSPEICWCTDLRGRAILLLSSVALKTLKANPLATEILDRPIVPSPLKPQQSSIEFYDSEVLAAFNSVQNVFKEMKVTITSSFAKLKDELLARDSLRKINLAMQVAQDLPLEMLSEAVRPHSSRLFPHQRIAVQWLLDTKRAFLGDDMGLGKTLSVLTAYQGLREVKESNLLLVICPNSLVRNWMREATFWFPDLKVESLAQTKLARAKHLKALSGSNDLAALVINYESLRLAGVVDALSLVIENRKVLLCVDESQRIKNPTSKTFLALKTVAKLCDRRVLLSGTPTPKDISDIWSQMFILDDGQRLGTNYYKWLETVAELGNKFSEYAVKQFRPSEVRETVERVHEVLLRRRKEEVIDLPDKVFSIRDVVLSGDQKKRYELVREKLLLRVSTVSGKVFVRELDNILEEYLRAVQVASNPRLIDETWNGDPAKFVELDSLVSEITADSSASLVIWTNYKKNVDELCQRYSTVGALPFYGDISTRDRDLYLEAFQNKEANARILIAIPAAGGVGITLTAASTAIYIDKTWNGEHWMQSIDRIHRIGQKGTVNIITLHGCAVDELISRNLNRKVKELKRLLGDGESTVGLPTREELLLALQRS